MTTSRDATSRLRQTLNPLRTTSLGGFHNQLHAPHSAVSVHPSYPYSAAQTPASSIQPYNPQEWAPSPVHGPERIHQFPQISSVQETQASSPPPPPPYSPPRSQRPASGIFETPPANISAARMPPSVHRPSPEPQPAHNFPPPPGANGRGASRERRFGLPSLGRRRDREAAGSPPDTHPPINSAQRTQGRFRQRDRYADFSPIQVGLPDEMGARTTEPIISPPTRRPPPSGVAALGPVPPTPADWIEGQRQGQGRSPNSAALTIDTSSVESGTTQVPPDSASGSSSAGGGLNRTGALRGEKSLRERRTESRTRHSSGESSSSVQPLSDIIVPQGANSSRPFSVHKGTPRSGRSALQESGDDNIDSSHSTPRPSAGLHPEAATPPFSPHSQKVYPSKENGHPIAPKSLPTPPPQSRSASSSSQARPEMHSSIGSLISTPVSAKLMPKHVVISQTADQFCQGSIERFQAFARAEAEANSDADRVKLFTDFVVSESRLRRERYSSAIGAMGSEIFDLTRDLFRPMNPRRDSGASQTSEWTPQLSESKSQRSSFGLVSRDQQSSSAPSSAGLPQSHSPINGPPSGANRNSHQYMPSLSPILSMSVSDALEADSRGRPASRWWEADSAGEGGRLERTKRESKYMGVPKEAREALQWEDMPSSAEGQSTSSNPYASSNEYPPEKVGWHDQCDDPDVSATTPKPLRHSLGSITASAPNTPSPSQLDVSRLVTLPPPYPRHHPAVNNNHPELTAIRVQVRALSDVCELQKTKEQFGSESAKMREEAAAAAAERRRALRTNLQQEINMGNMSYADAAAIEADNQVQEKAQAKETEKKDFEGFQTRVVAPLNELLTSRIAHATALFDELRSRLFVDVGDPNLPQEEGDEQPELLEKLTLLKWIFEARELLHREIYDLLSDRNDRYRDMVLTPYRLSGNNEKLRGAEAFFAEDAAKRRAAFADEVLRRTQEFRDVVEDTVSKGVEMQLNAFWDIAPPLRRLLDKIPASAVDLSSASGFRIQIPPAEYDENPVYHRHPLQYLYSLLLHAEKSTYQFIESQTNLQCLLHEVKEAVAGARAKAKLAEVDSDNSASAERERVIEAERRAEMDALTEDLKDKVRVVQDQWTGALGDAMRSVKEHVGEFLLSTGGWDESLEDRGVGSV
ncbi:hypothetical protein DL768_003694 [Monosporascus sp. mg162]|nr:hypothetical protein DL768_003694 [Monosporascus sp. mg162]